MSQGQGVDRPLSSHELWDHGPQRKSNHPLEDSDNLNPSVVLTLSMSSLFKAPVTSQAPRPNRINATASGDDAKAGTVLQRVWKRRQDNPSGRCSAEARHSSAFATRILTSIYLLRLVFGETLRRGLSIFVRDAETATPSGKLAPCRLWTDMRHWTGHTAQVVIPEIWI